MHWVYTSEQEVTGLNSHLNDMPSFQIIDKFSFSDSQDGKKEAADSSDGAKFSRRKLTSNWEKYEIQNEEDPHLGITQRGESFEKLLKSAGKMEQISNKVLCLILK